MVTTQRQVCLVRGLFSPMEIRAARLRYITAAQNDPARFGVASDDLRKNERWYAIWKNAWLELIPDDFAIYRHVLYPPVLRTVTTREDFVPWHQDAGYMAALGSRAHDDFITCFVPLDDEPSELPTLRFWRRDVDLLPHTPLARTRNSLQLDTKIEDGETFSFDLRSGDALLFAPNVVHETWCETERFPPRHSMEFRLTTASGRKPGRDYYDLEKRILYTML